MLKKLYDKGLIFDVELYRNCLVVSFYSLRANSYKTFVWFGDRNETKEMLQLIKNRILIGYNSWAYDCAILDHLLEHPDCTLLELWQFSQTLIKGERNPYRYNSKVGLGYDLLEVIRAGFSMISLKGAAVNLKHHKIQDLPIPFEAEITLLDLPDLISYNINDLDITKGILDYVKSQLEMRELLSESYGLNLYSLSDSGIGKELFSKQYVDRVEEKRGKANSKKIKYSRTHRKEIKFSDVILPEIEFETPELQAYLENMKTIVLREDGEELQSEAAGS